MAEVFGFYITVDEKIAAQRPHQLETGAGEGHVKLDLEGWRGEYQGTNFRRVIMGPGRHHHRADALREHGNVFHRHVVTGADVVDKGLHITHAGGEARTVAALAGRLAMAARVPSEEVEVGHVQFIDQMGHAPAVFVATVEHHHGALGCCAISVTGRPVAIEQLYAVVGGKAEFLGFTHRDILISS